MLIYERKGNEDDVDLAYIYHGLDEFGSEWCIGHEVRSI